MRFFHSFKITLLIVAFLFVTLVVIFGLLSPASGEQAEKTYVLTAGKWGDRQNTAVIMAGGTVTFSHRETGVGIAVSSAPDFLERALASRAFTDGALDMMVEWQPPMEVVQFDEAVITPGDEPYFSLQWNMQAIEAPGAWEAGYTGTGVRVAILDGGIDQYHEELAPNLDIAASASFVPGQNFDEDIGVFRHATHVAGIVAAADNGFGVIGVAPEATLIAVKVLHAGSGYFSWIIQGIEYASRSLVEGGGSADIINMSLLGYIWKARGAGPLVAALNKTINTATKRGVLVISAAGNDAFNFDHSWDIIVAPAESGNGIAISATGPVGFYYGATNFRRFASYSNSGNSLIHIAAPGGDYVYPDDFWWYDMVLSPGSGTDGYWWAAGTSMAAPAAAGVAALIKQRFPDISVGAWKNKLANTADDEGKPGHDALYGRGFVNALRAVTE